MKGLIVRPARGHPTRGQQPMATILRFQPRDRQGDTRPEDVHTDARTEQDETGQETIAATLRG